MDDIKADLMKSMMRLRKMIPQLNTTQNMHTTELFALIHIDAEKEALATGLRLQAALNINKSAVSQMLSSLEQKGYIERLTDPKDRRRMNLCLTPSGRVAMEEMKEYMKMFTTKVVDKFTPEKSHQLTVLFQEFADILEEVFAEITTESKGEPK